jgi:serine/threonine-protein kinase
MVGKTIGHYKVAEQIGAGGMGEVYRAHDTDLGRDVALKVIPPELATDPERLARFEREARLLASLNHPNVAVVHGLEAFDGIRVLAMELIPGDDLSVRIERGPTPADEALEIMRQVAEGLAAAHDNGIFHRDLKPANIKVTPEGSAKVLDFGLAKADPTQSGSGPLDMTQSPTITHEPTAAGVILGTAAYMSPEQARGRRTDRRADVWGWGEVLFEVLSGTRVFVGETVSDTLAAVLRAEPDWDALPKDTPPAIKRLLKRCLEKDVRRRLQDIGEARIAIENVQSGEADEAVAAAAAPATRRRPMARAIVVTALIAVVAFFAGQFGPGGKLPPRPIRKWEIRLESPAGDLQAQFSPDGERLIYVDDNRLWMRDLTRFEAQPIPGTEGMYLAAFSPDGQQLVAADGNHLYRIPIAGGERTRIATLEQDMNVFAGGMVWTGDDRVVFDRGSTGLFSVPASGGNPQEFLGLEEGQEDFHHLDELPGGKGYVFVIHTPNAYNQIAVLANGETHVVFQEEDDVGYPAWSPTGHILYSRFDNAAGVWALPFSLDRLEATGEPFLVVPDADGSAVSADGALIYRIAPQKIASQLVWVGVDGAPVDTILAIERQIDAWFSLSPDGRRPIIRRCGHPTAGRLRTSIVLQQVRQSCASGLRMDGASRKRLPRAVIRRSHTTVNGLCSRDTARISAAILCMWPPMVPASRSC